MQERHKLNKLTNSRAKRSSWAQKIIIKICNWSQSQWQWISGKEISVWRPSMFLNMILRNLSCTLTFTNHSLRSSLTSCSQAEDALFYFKCNSWILYFSWDINNCWSYIKKRKYSEILRNPKWYPIPLNDEPQPIWRLAMWRSPGCKQHTCSVLHCTLSLWMAFSAEMAEKSGVLI